MKTHIESLLHDDHESLDLLVAKLDAELATPDSNRAFELLDLFWARLAIHIRAENLHLFPALNNADPALYTGRDLPTHTEAKDVLAQLRSDHEFFMKELAVMIKAIREIADNRPAPTEVLEDLRSRMAVIKKRLVAHNRIEDERVYTWPSLLFDEATVAALLDSLRNELENLPPRFA